ncbi:MAG: hypothetical protein HQL93_12995 [Magnetococcales bacterium]|nr:hypothetical protein [Magnetococcales bacterium]
MMAIRSILFNATMARAVLAGEKTQMRRVIRPQPKPPSDGSYRIEECSWPQGFGFPSGPNNSGSIKWYRSPFGQIGDHLLAKESCWILGHWVENGMEKGYRKFDFYEFLVHGSPSVCFEKPNKIHQKGTMGIGWVHRSSIQMPQWASRITLEITGIRIEQVQNISEVDALREGVFLPGPSKNSPIGQGVLTATSNFENEIFYMSDHYAREEYERLFNSTYRAKGLGWDVNPWVWIVEFKVVSRDNV